MASPEKRCLYEVLGLNRDCTADEIRSAYRKLALQRHPDKLVRSGIPESEATASFQELVNAYEVLSDPRERSWYDSHRSQILYSNSNAKSSSSSVVPDLYGFFTNSVFSGYSDKGKGFYKVYGDLFDKIYRNELNFATKLGLGDVVKQAPLMGNLDSPYEQVNAFYGYWLGFGTVMDFAWEDMFDPMTGPNRKSRRVMEEDNKRIRKKARSEYNDMVRDLAKFVKKRDKRVIEMQLKRNEEMERKKEEERARKKEMERQKAERARAYQEPEWAKVEDVVEEEGFEEDERKNEFYCVACGKKFKSEKQWKNHEQSKKHKEKVAELREAFEEEEGESKDETESEDDVYEEVLGGNVDGSGFVFVDDEADKLKNEFERVEIQEEDEENGQERKSEEDEENGQERKSEDDEEHGRERKSTSMEENIGDNNDEDEASVLEAMLSGHKGRRNAGSTRKPKSSSKKAYVEVETEEVDLMEYNNRKGSRRQRGGRKEKGQRADEEEEQRADNAEISSKAKQHNGKDDGSHVDEPSSSQPSAISENDGQGDNESTGKMKIPKQAPEKKVVAKKDTAAKSKNFSEGKKQKATSKNSSHECDTCGVDFESRNKLHKHLNDTGHATLKSR